MRQQKQPRDPKRKNKDHPVCGQPWSEHTIVVGKVKGQIKPVWKCPDNDVATPHEHKAY